MTAFLMILDRKAKRETMFGRASNKDFKPLKGFRKASLFSLMRNQYIP
jgi:hypothetical protein